MCLCTVRDGIKTTVSTAEMQKIPLKKSFNESNTFVYVLLLLLPHQQYLHFDTGCSTHFQLYFPVLDTLLCVCVRLPSIRYTFNFWFMKHSVELVYTQYINTTHLYTEPLSIDMPPTHFYGNSVSVQFNCVYISLLINFTTQHKLPSDETF